MRFPQAYVFFKSSSTVTEQDVRDRFDENVRLAFITNGNRSSSAIHFRVKHAREAIWKISTLYPSLGSCAVINIKSLDAFFKLKFSQDIEEIMWIKSSIDAVKIRTTLKLYEEHWQLRYGIYRAHSSYQRIVQILDDECPDFLINDQIFSNLKNFAETFHDNSKLITDAIDHRLKSLCHIGKYAI